MSDRAARFQSISLSAYVHPMKLNKIYFNAFRLLIVILLIIAIFFRFVNLERKIYWDDEVYTSLWISGHTEQEAIEQVLNGREITVEDLKRYQQPNFDKSIFDSLKGLVLEDTQHTPLYYFMVVLWSKFWGQWSDNSVVIVRSFSAFLSLFVFPCIYWLALELFESSLTGWIAVAIAAVSPFYILTAQSAREYSWWIVTLLLVHVCLLKAMRLKNRLSWGLYGTSLAIAIYSHPFSLFVAISHGVYVLTIEGFRLSKNVINYLKTFFLTLISFVPWLIVLFANFSNVKRTTNWTSYNISAESTDLILSWARSLSRVFFDFWIQSNPGILFLVLISLTLFAIYFVVRQSSKAAWLFIIISLVIPALALILPDLILGGRRSSITRYLIPSYLGIQLAISYLLASKIFSNSIKIWQQKFWQFSLVMLISVGILSCATVSQATIWWNNGPSKVGTYRAIASIINQAEFPLIIGNSSFDATVSLSYLLDSKVRLKIQSQCELCKKNFSWIENQNIPKISNNFSDIFLFNPSALFKSKIEQKYVLESVIENLNFWRIKRK